MLEPTEDKSNEGPSSTVGERSPPVNKTVTTDRLVYKLVKVCVSLLKGHVVCSKGYFQGAGGLQLLPSIWASLCLRLRCLLVQG
jgi:hypothetical protein